MGDIRRGRQNVAGKKLSVRMFGGFSAKYAGEILSFGRQRDSKFRQLFQILMTRPGQDFSKIAVAESLYGWDEVEDSNASLNNTIFRLRKYLETSPLPLGEYIFCEAGVLRFGGNIEAESDVWEFGKLADGFNREQSRQEKLALCEKACELYRGEFLPQLSNEQWVIEQSRHYQKMYAEMLRYLLGGLKENGDYEKVEKYARTAAEIYPYEGWENWRLDSLVALGRHKEAEEIYQKTAKGAQKSDGLLSKKQQEQLRKIGDRVFRSQGTEEDIEKYLMENKPDAGAYACTLLGFSDCFRMLKRVAKRGKVYFSLILCTILDSGGCPAADTEYCEKQGEKLRAAFRTHLRRGDIYTRYSENQYLLLCIGVGKEDSFEIGARIGADFRKRCGGRGKVSCRLLDDGELF